MKRMTLFRGMLLLSLVLCVGLPSHSFGERSKKAGLFLKLPNDWRVAKSHKTTETSWRIYLKRGDNPIYYKEAIKVETRDKGLHVSVPKMEKKYRKTFSGMGCKTDRVSRTKDAKRSMLRYECAKAKRSGAMLTVEGENQKVYSIFYEMPKEKLSSKERKRLTTFLRENAKICDRTDRTKCVR